MGHREPVRGSRFPHQPRFLSVCTWDDTRGCPITRGYAASRAATRPGRARLGPPNRPPPLTAPPRCADPAHQGQDQIQDPRRSLTVPGGEPRGEPGHYRPPSSRPGGYTPRWSLDGVPPSSGLRQRGLRLSPLYEVPVLGPGSFPFPLPRLFSRTSSSSVQAPTAWYPCP